MGRANLVGEIFLDIIERFGYEDYTPEILHWSDPIDEFFVKHNL